MAETALEQKEHILNGKKIEPKYATPDIPRYKRTIPELEAQMDEECKNKRSIFVGALKDTIGEEDLVRYFSGFGKVIRAVKIYDKETGNKKTFGFVDFADFGIVRKVMNVTKHYIQGKRIRVELSRPRIEFSHQTKNSFRREFGFVTRALRIPNKDEPKRKFGFVDFDDYDAVDIVVSQREHFIDGHRLRVELALPLINDSLYEKDVVVPGETWMEKVQRGPDVKTVRFKIPRGMLEYVVGMAGKVIEEIANDTNTRVVVKKPSVGAKNVIFTVTGKSKDVMSAQYIFQQIVKSNIHKLNTVRPITNS
ncbi:HNRNPA1_3 [Lepeophtheirus salmonis]|uniref:HNRNPA1_3 n=1 Tax=Lepeophtheirus salmonis TaxID=72036 RepID=A0A7R8D2U4_LEPSM|nr:HNRNPA1_3 [Lepeophtheirus salmonis]CAF2959262.1 HNRNPA1_3 [Lepeophtheirus salmonis]